MNALAQQFASLEVVSKFPTMWTDLALKHGKSPSILSHRIIDRMESRSKSEAPCTVFGNSVLIDRRKFCAEGSNAFSEPVNFALNMAY